MTEKELADIAKRNQNRRMLNKSTSPSFWSYESFGYVHQTSGVKPSKRIGILVRPMTWFRALQKRYGSSVLDQGVPQSAFLPVRRRAQHILEALNESAEEDVAALLMELSRLRRQANQRRARSASANGPGNNALPTPVPGGVARSSHRVAPSSPPHSRQQRSR